MVSPYRHLSIVISQFNHSTIPPFIHHTISPFHHEYWVLFLNWLPPFHYHPFFMFSLRIWFTVSCGQNKYIVTAATQKEGASNQRVKIFPPVEAFLAGHHHLTISPFHHITVSPIHHSIICCVITSQFHHFSNHNFPAWNCITISPFQNKTVAPWYHKIFATLHYCFQIRFNITKD